MAVLASRKLNNTFAFGANTTASTKSVAIPRARWLRRVKLLLTAVVATVGTTPNLQAMPRLINSVALKGEGNTSYFDISGEDLFQNNVRDYGTSTIKSGTIATTATYRTLLTLDLAVDNANSRDWSALIPAHLLNTLDLVISTNTTFTACGNSDTVLTSLNVEVVIDEVHMSDAEATEMYGTGFKGVAKIFQNQKHVPIAAANTNYSGEVDLQVGYVIKNILFRNHDSVTGTAVSADNKTTSYLIEQTGQKGNFEWDRQDYYNAQYEDVIQYSVTTLADVVGSFRYDPMSKALGLDTRGMKQGDLKFKFNNSDTSCGVWVTQTNIIVPEM